MFDELVPPELREHLACALGVRRMVEGMMAWVRSVAIVPPEFDAVVAAELARMDRAARCLVDRYKRGEITLPEFESALEVEFDWNRDPTPEMEALMARGPFPRRL